MIKLYRETRSTQIVPHPSFQTGGEDESRMKELSSIISLATDDYVQKRIPTNNVASHHLLMIYLYNKDYEAGSRVWNWLVKQSDDCLDANCYAVAINLLEQSGCDLAQLEELYQEALRRYPASFVEYHFSPGAILPDRDSPVPIAGLPLNLLRIMARTRLRLGANLEAYKALDTLLRLEPTSAPNRKADSIFQWDRTVSAGATAQAWMLFMLANSMSPDSYRIPQNTLINMINMVDGTAPLMVGPRMIPSFVIERSDILDSVVTFNRMAECTRVFGKIDDERNSSCVLLLLRRLAQCALPPTLLSGSLTNSIRLKYNQDLFLQGQRLLVMTINCSVNVFRRIATQMCILAGQAEDVDSVKGIRDEFLRRAASGDIGMIMAQHAEAIRSLGLVTTDSAPLRDAWALAKSTAQSAEIHMPVWVWESLAEAIQHHRRQDDLQWFEDELATTQEIDPTKKQELLALAKEPATPPYKYEDRSSFEPDFLGKMVESITKAIDRLEDPLGHVARLDYGFYDLPDVNENFTKLKRSLLHTIPEETLRRVYDKLTTDPAQLDTSFVREAVTEDTATESEDAVPITAADESQASDTHTVDESETQADQTNASDMSIADLRFYHWSAMNHLFAYNRETAMFTAWVLEKGKLQEGFDWRRRKVRQIFKGWQGSRRYRAAAEWKGLMKKKGDEGERQRVNYVKNLIIKLRGLDDDAEIAAEGKELLF